MPSILVVDDSAVDRAMVDGVLKQDPTLSVEIVDNGHTALTRLKEASFDAVVTDLQMPEVNGLQLVTTIRVDHPQVPVILMTAHGSEALAMEALEQGAASYVPKRQLADRLLDTVQEVVALASAQRAYGQLINCFDYTEFGLSLENDVELIEPLVDYVQQMVTGMQLCDATGGYQVGVALREALLNALYRGNLEITREQIEEEREKLLEGIHTSVFDRRCAEKPYCDRKIYVKIRVDRNEARFIVRDEGAGFDVSSMPSAGDATAMGGAGGRGYVLMSTFMDEVKYNEAGNEVTLVIKRGEALQT